MARVAVSGRSAVPQRQNLLTQPNAFDNAAWIKINSTISLDGDPGPSASALASIGADVSSLPLDGIIPDVGAGLTVAVVQANFDTPIGANGRLYTASVVAKAGVLGQFGILLSPSGGGDGVYFGLAAGTVGTIVGNYTASIVALGSGYYRCIATYRAQAFTPTFDVFAVDTDGIPTTSSGTGSSIGCFLGGAQVTTASQAGNLTVTGTPLTSPLRNIASGRVAVPVSQNILVRSEEFGNAAWNVSTGVGIVSNTTVAPDGNTTADLINPSGGAGIRHYAGQAFSMPTGVNPKNVSPRLVLASCYFKNDGTTWVFIGNDRHTDFVYQWFNIATRTVGSNTGPVATAIPISAGIENATVTFPGSPSGWSRCWFYYLMQSPSGGAGANAEGIIVGPTTGDAVQIFDSAAGVFCSVWGASLLVGANQPGKYVQTVAAQVDNIGIRSTP